jgi:hypothetical protein
MDDSDGWGPYHDGNCDGDPNEEDDDDGDGDHDGNEALLRDRDGDDAGEEFDEEERSVRVHRSCGINELSSSVANVENCPRSPRPIILK